MKNIIFDFGNVIIEWRPFLALSEQFETEDEMQSVFETIGFYEWNLEMDRGMGAKAGLEKVAREKPEHAHIFNSYVENIGKAHANTIPGMIDLIRRVQRSGLNLFGLTNACEEAYQAVRHTAPIIDEFRDTIVSAREKLIKPDPAIFQMILERNHLSATETLFVDDKIENCIAAERVGMASHEFKNATLLEQDFLARGIL